MNMYDMEMVTKEVKYVICKYVNDKFSMDITFKDGTRSYKSDRSMDRLKDKVLDEIDRRTNG